MWPVERGFWWATYSLTVGGIGHAEAIEPVKKAVPRYLIPVVILARLGVDEDLHGQGLGKGLLKDALIRTALAANIAGIRALLVVHAKDDQARAFNERYDFEPGATDPLPPLSSNEGYTAGGRHTGDRMRLRGASATAASRIRRSKWGGIYLLRSGCCLSQKRHRGCAKHKG